MRNAWSMSCCVLLLLASGCAPKVNDPADIQAVKQTVEAYAKAVNAGDAEGEVAMMTDKTVYADNHFPVAVGKAAVKAMAAGGFSLFTFEFQAPVDDVRVAGDSAVARGTWSITLTPKVDGMAAVSDSGSWALSASRQADRSWKWDWVIPNSSQPMPGTTAAGGDEQALLQLEAQWSAADAAKDPSVVDKFLAKEFVSVFDGQTSTRAQVLAEIKNSASKIESAGNSDVRTAVFGETAIVHGLYSEKSTTNGKDSSQRIRYTEVYVKRDGRWQCVTQFLAKVS